MGKIFPGERSHWVMIALVTLLLYGVGTLRLHVTQFNSFTALLFILVAILILALRRTARAGAGRRL